LRTNDCAARDRLVERYAYLCRRGAQKFLRRGLERRDLEQIAAIGLLKACDRYDPAIETPFEAYAWLLIVGELMHHVRSCERLVRLPRALYEQERAYRRALDRLTTRLHREPIASELAADLGLSVARVRELACAASGGEVLSFDALPPSTVERAREGGGLATEDRLVLEHALADLPPLQRSVILALYGLGLTQSELAARFALHPRRVSRLHRRALDAMRERVA